MHQGRGGPLGPQYANGYCLTEIDDWSPPSKLKAPMLTRICWSWREVVVDMPSLWCQIMMHVRAAGDCKRFAMTHGSRGRSLSLALQCPYSWVRFGGLLQLHHSFLSLSLEFV
ncbi:hypothetical protein P692DRAFT_20721372 [Suillus brevipes Sb2]|nr:hypothetical protein P692DRAFT_20721372 [Suillus brevipes Sb2]